MNLDDILSQLDEISELLAQSLEPITTNLDPRVGRLYSDPDRTLIAVRLEGQRSLEYYGGFEYIDREYVHAIGDWVIYDSMAKRVQEALS